MTPKTLLDFNPTHAYKPTILMIPYRPRSLACLLIAMAAVGPLAGTAGGSATVRHAANFDLQTFADHQRITVRNLTRHAQSEHQYALVPKGKPLPVLPPEWTVIRTPVERVVAMETVYIGHLAALGELDRIVGVGTPGYVSDPRLRERIETGAVAPVQGGHQLDIEQLLLLQPDLILTSVTGDPAFDVPEKLSRTRLPVFLSASYMEQDPLARAEWIKCFAALVGASDRAERIFARHAERYATLRAKAAAATDRPSVFCAAPYSGVWHMPGGASYTACLIEDAGGRYLWAADDAAGSIPLDTERVFLRASDADFWLNPSFYRSLEALFAADPRFRNFEAAETGAVYNNTRQVSEKGGNAIWERGVTEPDVVLADLIRILHPELLPERDFVYYERLR